MQTFNVACFSDLHLGHRRNDTHVMIGALDESILHSGLLKRIKLLLLAGDVFDRLLELNHPAIHEVDRWIWRLFRACEKNGVVLRVLEGTPSHDRHQSQRFKTIHEVSGSQCDFRYVDQIEIEHIERLDINVLYIPDEISPAGTQVTKAVVQSLLESRGLDQVDLCCMHGFFKYQLPYDVKESAYHDEDFYQSITRYWIFIGHVHNHTRRGKIVAQGSHDRLSHGEEEPKGFVQASVGDPNGDSCYFIENKKAHTYKTIQCYGMEVGHAFEKIEAELVLVGDLARVRIEAEPQHPIFTNMVELQKKYPTLNFTPHPKSVGEGSPLSEAAKEPEIIKWHAVEITKDNIVEMVSERLGLRDIGPTTAARALQHLREFA